MPEPLLIEVAINGWMTKEDNPRTPISPAEVIASVTACFEAGAQIIHAHAGDAFVGDVHRHQSEPYIEAFGPLQKAYPDAILYPTLPGGGADITMDDRYAHIRELLDAGLLKMAPIDPGSMNWGFRDESGAPKPGAPLYQNSLDDVAYSLLPARAYQYALDLRARLSATGSGASAGGHLAEIHGGEAGVFRRALDLRIADLRTQSRRLSRHAGGKRHPLDGQTAPG